MKYNQFNLNFDQLFSCNFGELIPVKWFEVNPSDKIQSSVSALVRTQPLNTPVYGKVNVQFFQFFVPNRIMWDDWENFITGGPDGDNASVHPYITTPASVGFPISSLADYLGIKPGVASKQVSALPFRAYNMIWNYFFRDQDLQTPRVVSMASGSDTTTATGLNYGCWRKDYLTTARAEPQKGSPVTIPLVGNAPVITDGTTPTFTGAGVTNAPLRGNSGQYMNTNPNFSSTNTLAFGNNSGLEADLSDVAAVDIVELRTASAIQRFRENMQRRGSRYQDLLRSRGVGEIDARLQEPEFLGGGMSTIQFSEVIQTAEGTDPVGELRGHGISAGKSNRVSKYYPEHGIVMVLMCIRPEPVYVDAVSRGWLRRTKEDYFTPELQSIGQQPVYNGEVDLGHTDPYATWAYNDRYDEYRSILSGVSGEFRDTLDTWHLGRIFDTPPAFNSSFVNGLDVTNRIFAAPTADQFYVRAIGHVKAKRKLARVAKNILL